MVLRSCWLITLLCIDSHHTCSGLIKVHADDDGGGGLADDTVCMECHSICVGTITITETDTIKETDSDPVKA